MSYTDIVYERRDAVVTITLNRPEKRNPIGPHTIGELLHALERVRNDAAAHVVVITGAGQVFSAGGDLGAFTPGPEGKPLGAHAGPFSVAGSYVDLTLAFTKLGKPSIAMVNGHAIAGGLGLMLMCDLAIASEHALFAAPEINVGLWPMMISATLFRHVPRKRGLELIMTGERVDAKHALELGLITRHVPRMNLQSEVDALCEKITSKSPLIMKLGLEAFHASQDMALQPALEYLEQRLLAVLSTEDSMEGRTAFLENVHRFGAGVSVAFFDRYESFIGWRYLYDPRNSKPLKIITVAAFVVTLVLALVFFKTHNGYAGALTLPLSLVFVVLLLLNFFSTFTSISMVGVVFGVAALSVVFSVASGFEGEFRNKILGVNAHITVMKYGQDFAEYPEVIAKMKSHAEVKTVAPFVFYEMMVAHGSSLSGLLVKGVDPTLVSSVLDLQDRLEEGQVADLAKTLAPNDGGAPLPAMFIGRELKKKLKAKIGDRVRLIMPKPNMDPLAWSAQGENGPAVHDFRVAGSFYCGFDDYDRRLAYVDLKSGQALSSGGDVVGGIEAKLYDPMRAEAFATKLQDELGASPYRVLGWAELNHNLFEAIKLQKLILVIFLTLIILVAAFNIVAALTMMVIDKGREIAILKSIGMRSFGTARIFQVVGLCIGAIGTSCGLAVALLLCEVIAQFGYKLDATVYLIDRLPVDISVRELGMTVVITMIICSIATLYPAMRAARLAPVEGLRAE